MKTRIRPAKDDLWKNKSINVIRISKRMNEWLKEGRREVREGPKGKVEGRRAKCNIIQHC